MYSSFNGEPFPVVSYITYPPKQTVKVKPYLFPYHDSAYGTFQHMLAPGEKPVFADSDKPFPLVVLAALQR